jgi:hypothetical protein
MELTIYSNKLDPANKADQKAFQKRVAARIRLFEDLQNEEAKAIVLTAIAKEQELGIHENAQ